MITTLEDPPETTHPLEIININLVDDNGGQQIETQMTARFIVDLYRRGLLSLTGNIRPAHQQDRLVGKTKTKVNKWTTELLDNNAIIGNISVRLDPTKSEHDIWNDPETGLTNMTITAGVLDCAVDSLSRIKAILAAADNPLGSFDLDTRFQVRIWLLDDDAAKKVATIYNTRGDKVNDSTAKYAYSETKEQELARRLVNGSEHLGQDNIEVLSNSVSASSHKLAAFNTISKAIETSWKGGPATAADVEAQTSWLISAWDSLVKVRPEFGKLSTPARQEQRKANIASTAVAIYGLIGAMSTMYADHVDPDVAFKALAKQGDEDPFDWDNPAWSDAGVVTPTGTGSLGTRNSFPARKSATRVLQQIMGLNGETDESAS
ncbi:DNA sulfur modification protein DndB [Luteipulveratus sp. YIM 133132]|uniref:DNA sulfur modification protein DndB n=1 Tax=Luteipulveratus flavus TaxID=3031728 RepID=UPI0023B07626|nr:DNA sulfur modification protein DndB [Luteipulveratus sp. YIM 133132]MDE9363993.1 DNA sulfur modification protein DndB [Luteipulveratus sp. YIM 133132]